METMSFAIPVKKIPMTPPPPPPPTRMEYQPQQQMAALPPPQPPPPPNLGQNGPLHQPQQHLHNGASAVHHQQLLAAVAAAAGASDEPAKWSQYQQLWRQHVYVNGNNKSSYNHAHGQSSIKELAGNVLGGSGGGTNSHLPDDKSKDDNELWYNEAQTAFLGPNLWDKTYDTDLKYVDLDEFLSENGVSMDGSNSLGGLPGAPSGLNSGPGGTGHPLHAHTHHLHPLPKRERSASPSECLSPADTLNPPSPADSTLSMASSSRDFDPRTRAFSDEELKPQPMIKKSRKQFVPDSLKDDKYWARRRKNNMAAKRSRDARRMKENQIALRAGYLEKENIGLRQELDRLKKENLLLRDKLSKCGDV